MPLKSPLPYPLLSQDRQRQSWFPTHFPRKQALSLLLATLIVLTYGLLNAQTINLPGSARRLSVSHQSSLICAALTTDGVAFVSYHDHPNTPQVYSFAKWPTVCSLPLEKKGSFLLGDRFGSLRIIQATKNIPENSYEFQELNTWKTEGIPTGLLLDGNKLYVAAGATGILIYEWNTPDSQPTLQGRYPFVDYSRQLSLSPDKETLFVADNLETGIIVLNVKDPYRPRLIYSKDSGFVEANSNTGNLVAYGIRHRGTALVDFTTPSTPVLRQSIILPEINNPTVQHRVNQVRFTHQGKNLLICEGKHGARLFTWDKNTERYKLKKTYLFPGKSCLDGVFTKKKTIAFSLHPPMLIFRAVN